MDKKIGAAIQHAFQCTGRSWLQHLSVEVSDACVVLRGEVPSFYLKQLAQEAVLAVPGVAGLKNELHVADCATHVKGQ